MKGKALKTWREGFGWSQLQAATALGIDRRQFQEAEGGGRELDLGLTILASSLELARDHSEIDGPIGGFIGKLRDKIAAVNAMPRPGRPKKDPYLAALEDLHERVSAASGFLRNAAAGQPVSGSLPRQAFTRILEALRTADVGKDLHDAMKAEVDE